MSTSPSVLCATVVGVDEAGGVEASLRRPFGWGVVFVGDAGADALEVDPHRPVTWSSGGSSAAVLVHHAQDVDVDRHDLGPHEEVALAEVTVVVHPGPAGDRPVDADGHVTLPSGRWSIGDADDDHILTLTPGRRRLQFVLEPLDHADRVDVWVSPGEDADRAGSDEGQRGDQDSAPPARGPRRQVDGPVRAAASRTAPPPLDEPSARGPRGGGRGHGPQEDALGTWQRGLANLRHGGGPPDRPRQAPAPRRGH